MPYANDIGVWGNSDAKARRILTDPRGGSPTFGPWVDIPGVSKISVKAEVSNIEAIGDNETCVNVSRTKHLTASAEFARESIDALKTLLGGVDVESGTTPNREREWQDTDDKHPAIELSWVPQQDDDSPDGDVVRTLHRAVVTSYELADTAEESSKPTFELKATRRKSDGKRFTIKPRETGTPLTEGALSTTPPTVTAFSPTDNAVDQEVDLSVSITFSTNVNHNTASEPGNYYFANAASGAPVSFAFDYNSTTRVATLTPAANLSANTKYVAGITAGIKSVDGVRAVPNGVDFTTEA